MLVLSRKPSEDIVIGEPPNEIVVRVVEIRGDKVRIGIVADKSVAVNRREIFDLIHGEHSN